MSQNSYSGRILGIDFGHRRIGIALSDPLRISAQSLSTIQVHNINKTFTELANIIAERDVSEIVVGMPLNLKGEKGIFSIME